MPTFDKEDDTSETTCVHNITTLSRGPITSRLQGEAVVYIERSQELYHKIQLLRADHLHASSIASFA